MNNIRASFLLAALTIALVGYGTNAGAQKGKPAPRFIDNGNGTITDSQTGLMWEKKTACALPSASDIHCVKNRYQWSTDHNNPNGSLFTDFLRRINATISTSPDGVNVADVCFAGHCDWRVPNVAELQTIVKAPYPSCETAGPVPCIDSIFGPTEADGYWTSTKDAVVVDGAWDVSFFNGAVNGNVGVNLTLFVRAVRSAR
jgi:hypothetical protein